MYIQCITAVIWHTIALPLPPAVVAKNVGFNIIYLTNVLWGRKCNSVFLLILYAFGRPDLQRWEIKERVQRSLRPPGYKQREMYCTSHPEGDTLVHKCKKVILWHAYARNEFHFFIFCEKMNKCTNATNLYLKSHFFAVVAFREICWQEGTLLMSTVANTEHCKYIVNGHYYPEPAVAQPSMCSICLHCAFGGRHRDGKWRWENE